MPRKQGRGFTAWGIPRIPLRRETQPERMADRISASKVSKSVQDALPLPLSLSLSLDSLALRLFINGSTGPRSDCLRSTCTTPRSLLSSASLSRPKARNSASIEVSNRLPIPYRLSPSVSRDAISLWILWTFRGNTFEREVYSNNFNFRPREKYSIEKER